jgi:peptidoglycan/xylan/chitin deacetylase (PgdA/CDA1 family)
VSLLLRRVVLATLLALLGGCGGGSEDAEPSAPLPRARVLLTFDDATSTVFTAARPILDAAGMRGTVFAVGSLVGSDPWFMTLDQLKQLYASGWDVGSHTWSHQALSQQIWAYTRSGATATLTFAQPHRYVPGDTLTIRGCEAPGFDGMKTVEAVPDAQTITFAAVAGDEAVAGAGCHVVGGVSAETIRAELLVNREWLTSHGFVRAKDHLAYPYGAWDPAVIATWRDELGGRSARIVGPTSSGEYVLPGGAPSAAPHLLPSWDLNDVATAAAALAQVDAAIAAEGTLIFLGHGVAPSNPYSTQMLESEFRALVDGLAARRAAGQLQVVTISEWFDSE